MFPRFLSIIARIFLHFPHSVPQAIVKYATVLLVFRLLSCKKTVVLL